MILQSAVITICYVRLCYYVSTHLPIVGELHEDQASLAMLDYVMMEYYGVVLLYNHGSAYPSLVNSMRTDAEVQDRRPMIGV